MICFYTSLVISELQRDVFIQLLRDKVSFSTDFVAGEKQSTLGSRSRWSRGLTVCKHKHVLLIMYLSKYFWI